MPGTPRRTPLLAAALALTLSSAPAHASDDALPTASSPEATPHDAPPLRIDRRFGMALDVVTAVTPGLVVPLPGLRFDVALDRWLSFEVRGSTLVVITALELGLRVWLLEGNFSPTLFADAGFAILSFGSDECSQAPCDTGTDTRIQRVARAGAGIDYTTDDGLLLGLDLGYIYLLEDHAVGLGLSAGGRF